MLKRTCRVATAIMLIVASTVHGYVSPISIKELVEKSAVIVVAKVTGATPQKADEVRVRIATATVLAVWKGPATLRQVHFVASPTWTCDIADAKVGETAILFLAHDDQQDAFVIMHAGRGRMPIEGAESDQRAVIWADVLLPRGTRLYPGPEPEYAFIRAISVGDLESIVSSLVSK